tara:strand:+ start:1021 stop:1389 length:369 start_codon:yes stop_codon:yes gene_type:complete
MKIITIISLCLLLSNCSMLQSVKPVQVKTISERAPIYHPPLPYPMSLTEVDWQVMTPVTMQEYLENLESGNATERAFYTLSSQEYQNLSMTMSEVTRYTRDILSIIKYYRELDKAEEDVQKR